MAKTAAGKKIVPVQGYKKAKAGSCFSILLARLTILDILLTQRDLA